MKGICRVVAIVTWASIGLQGQVGADENRESGMCNTKGAIYIVDGVGGFGLGAKLIEKTFIDAHVPHEIRQFYWSHGFGRWHADLTDEANLRRKGSELADWVMGFRVRHGTRPVFLLAKSGGAAVALSALAELPPETVERVVLLSAAVSPEYDLVPALRAVRHEIVSFWSPKDKLVLGLGTSLFGTADRVAGEAAGLVGFKTPKNLQPEAARQYQKLRQLKWEPSMRKTYNYGTHIGTTMPMFIRHYVVPLLGGQGEPEATRASN